MNKGVESVVVVGFVCVCVFLFVSLFLFLIFCLSNIKLHDKKLKFSVAVIPS